jgi:D-alanyl-lipoteichoic acid acyltransferase DltB (MBOAT superfamily)
MLFNSSIFALFFAAFFPLYLLLRRNVFWRNILLIVASYCFYGWWDARFLILVAISTAVDYMAALGAAGKPVRSVDRLKSVAYLAAVTAAALAVTSLRTLWLVLPLSAGVLAAAAWIKTIDRATAERRPRLWLYLSLVTNLGILAFFKYFNFFVGSFIALFAPFGIKIDAPTLSIVLPVGLSFYTFQALSRTIDSYRHSFEPQYSIVNYAAYHAFFPQLVAGPIERARHLMPQFEAVRPLDARMFYSGALLFLWGLYQKIVIADNLAPIADAVFTAPAGKSSAATLGALLAFTLQIYCDFCGYSNMARGLARCLGFDLMVNFNLPYFARTPSEFWQRWHISLSSWLRDYLYIPLGGNRDGRLRTYRNVMITMLLGGLWHGAAWNFVIWGAWHGAIQVLYRVLRIDALLGRWSPLTARGVVLQICAWAVTMILVMIGWVFFVDHTVADTFAVFGNLLGSSGYPDNTLWTVAAYGTPLALVEIYQRTSGRLEILNSGPFLVRYTAALSVLLTIIAFSARGGREFIYFEF